MQFKIEFLKMENVYVLKNIILFKVISYAYSATKHVKIVKIHMQILAFHVKKIKKEI